VASSLEVAAIAAIAVSAASVYRQPDSTSEVVTTALFNVPAEIEELVGTKLKQWARIRLSDYEGWVPAASLAVPAMSREWLATIVPLSATIYADAEGDRAIGSAYATTVLPAGEMLASAARVPVQLPGGASGWLDSSAAEVRPRGTPPPQYGPETAISLARRLLGTPYLWGGTTSQGIDCSGLMQLCCRAAGVTIPRDADQQYKGIPYIVERGDLRAGDLIYFASSGKITHTGLMVDQRSYIHAKGSPESRVLLTGLEPGETNYHSYLAGHYAGARRPWPSRGRRILV
jgi:cell wall-associated NlpC family hydrolase